MARRGRKTKSKRRVGKKMASKKKLRSARDEEMKHKQMKLIFNRTAAAETLGKFILGILLRLSGS